MPARCRVSLAERGHDGWLYPEWRLDEPGSAGSEGLPDRIPCGPCALSCVALLAALRGVSGRRGGWLAGAERLSRVVSGSLGLGLLEIVSRKKIRGGARLVGLGERIVRVELV